MGNKHRRVMIAMTLFLGTLLGVIVLGISWRRTPGEKPEEGSISTVSETSHPKATAIPAGDPSIFHEDTTDVCNFNAQGCYDNSKRLSCDLGYGIHLRLGAGTTDEVDGICIDPVLCYDYALNVSEPYGFLIRFSRGDLYYCGSPQPLAAAQNLGVTSLYIAGRTYDKLTPAMYASEEAYGIKWVNDISGDSLDMTGAELIIHAIRLVDGSLMGAAKAEISFDLTSSCYYLSSLISSDVRTTGELSAWDREKLVNAAVSFFNTCCPNIQTDFSEADLSNIKDQIVVERTGRVLFNKLYNAKGDAVPAGRFAGREIYAVNIPASGLGYVTAYFCHIDQAKGLTRVENENLDYVIVGYDAVNRAPFNTDTFNSLILPEDREKFGVL